MSEKKKTFAFETRAVHAGQSPAPENKAVMTPVYQNTTYEQSSPGVYAGYDYSRTANPTRTAFEGNMASLEGGARALAFASGCAATSAVLQLLSAGDHVLCGDDLYGGTVRLFDQVYARQGLEFSYFDFRDIDKVKDNIQPNTKLIWIETPTNPLLRLYDIEAVCDVAALHGVLVAVDNTFCSPFLQQPLRLGADIVVHSTTKYIGGHSDVLGGVVIAAEEELGDRLAFIQNAVGAVPAPWDCFLLLRSTKTLALRMERHSRNALSLAQFLEDHDEVEKVIYPGLQSHPQFSLAQKQMMMGGGMISCVVKGGLKRATSFLEAVELFTLAESLGGVESLIEHPALMTHASIPAERRKDLGFVDGLLRLSVGVEAVEDLRQDIDQALKKSAKRK